MGVVSSQAARVCSATVRPFLPLVLPSGVGSCLVIGAFYISFRLVPHKLSDTHTPSASNLLLLWMVGRHTQRRSMRPADRSDDTDTVRGRPYSS